MDSSIANPSPERYLQGAEAISKVAEMVKCNCKLSFNRHLGVVGIVLEGLVVLNRLQKTVKTLRCNTKV